MISKSDLKQALFIKAYIQQKKERTMNEEITNPTDEAVLAAPATQLTDAEVEAILASKPIYVTEGDEAGEVTIH